jgi:transcriptional regulator with GAF, ATPase, and Fis domain
MAGIAVRYERLLEAGLALGAELSLPVALQRIVELAAELTGARYGALGVLGRDGRISEFITTGVTATERAAIGPLPVGRGILGVLIDDPRPLRLHDLADDPRSVGFPARHPPVRSFLGVPVTARGRVYGNLYLTEKRGGGDFDTDDERALVLLAAQAGVAIENAQLYQEARDRAQRLEAVRAITTAMLAGVDPAELLGQVVGQARRLVDADLATLACRPGRGACGSRPPTGWGPASSRAARSRPRARWPARCWAPARPSPWPTPRPRSGPPSRSSVPGSARRWWSPWPCAAPPWAR